MGEAYIVRRGEPARKHVERLLHIKNIGDGVTLTDSEYVFDGTADAKIEYADQTLPVGAKSIKGKIKKDGMDKALEVLGDNADMSENNHGTSLSLLGVENLLSGLASTDGKYLNTSDGKSFVDDSSYGTFEDYIQIDSNYDLYVGEDGGKLHVTAAETFMLHFYDISQDWISLSYVSGENVTAGASVTPPSNAVYIRLCYRAQSSSNFPYNESEFELYINQYIQQPSYFEGFSGEAVLNFSSYQALADKRFSLNSNISLTDDNLYDIMCTWDGTTNADRVKMYIKFASEFKWRQVASQAGTETQILSLVEFNGELYGGTVPNGKLMKWNGIDAWIEVASSFGVNCFVWSLVVFENEIYAGIEITEDSVKKGKLLKWNGIDEWVEIVGEVAGVAVVHRLLVFNNEIYAATRDEGKLMKWNGIDAWIEVAPQYESESIIYTLIEFGEELYASTLNNGNLLKWNGIDEWIQVAPKLGIEWQILSLVEFNGELYGGTRPNGKLVKWNGIDAWIEVVPQYESETMMFILLVYNDNLYGISRPSGKLLRWNGDSTWTEVASQFKNELMMSGIVFNNGIYGGSREKALLVSAMTQGMYHNGTEWVASIEPHATTTALSVEVEEASSNLMLGNTNGKNLFDKDTVNVDQGVRVDNGELEANSSFDATDFVPILPNTTYSFSHATGSTTAGIAWYDSDKVFISGQTIDPPNDPYTLTSPNGSYYLRTTIGKYLAGVSADVFQIEKGSTATPYQPYAGDGALAYEGLMKDVEISNVARNEMED